MCFSEKLEYKCTPKTTDSQLINRLLVPNITEKYLSNDEPKAIRDRGGHSPHLFGAVNLTEGMFEKMIFVAKILLIFSSIGLFSQYVKIRNKLNYIVGC